MGTIMQPQDRNIALAIIFSIITCGIYGFFVVYQSAKRIYQYETQQGIAASDDSVMLTVLALFVCFDSKTVACTS